jgi:putative heme iron utilization protein
MVEQDRNALRELLAASRVAALGTLHQGFPSVSLILYAIEPDRTAFLILASLLAHHTQDFLADPRASFMIAEPDLNSRNPQTLMRVSLLGKVARVPDDEIESARLTYLERFPKSTMLFQLGDFALYRFVPQTARFVAGFGKTYNLTEQEIASILPRSS